MGDVGGKAMGGAWPKACPTCGAKWHIRSRTMGAAVGQPHKGRCVHGHWWNEPTPPIGCRSCAGRGYVGLADCPRCEGTGEAAPAQEPFDPKPAASEVVEP